MDGCEGWGWLSGRASDGHLADRMDARTRGPMGERKVSGLRAGTCARWTDKRPDGWRVGGWLRGRVGSNSLQSVTRGPRETPGRYVDSEPIHRWASPWLTSPLPIKTSPLPPRVENH